MIMVTTIIIKMWMRVKWELKWEWEWEWKWLWNYKLTKKEDFFNNIKMSYCWFNRQEILKEAKERYSKEKAGECYLKNKDAIKQKARDVRRGKKQN